MSTEVTRVKVRCVMRMAVKVIDVRVRVGSEYKIPVFIINFDISLSWLFFIHLNFEKDCIKDFILITEFFGGPLKFGPEARASLA